MFRNYFKVALRGLWKRKFATLLNLTGLTIGLTCCSLFLLFYTKERSYDNFTNAGNIYRVVSVFKDGHSAPTTSLRYASFLKMEIPEIVAVSRLDASINPNIIQVKQNSGTVSTPFVQNDGYWVDSTFFTIFNFNGEYGDLTLSLKEPNSVVLSKPVAVKLFGDRNPVGEALKIDNHHGVQTYIVKGVFKNDLLNHFNADFFASNNSDSIRGVIERATNWVTDPNYYTYISLRPGSNPKQVEQKLNRYLQTHAGSDMKSSGTYLTNTLQSLKSIHLHSQNYYTYLEVKQGNIKYLYLLGSIALGILIISCINFVNLSIAQSIDRAKEVGIRRVFGAGNKMIRLQLITEIVMLSFISLFFAIGLSILILPEFNRLINQDLSIFEKENRSLIFWLLLSALITGIISGIYPAKYLSSFDVLTVLKSRIKSSAGMLRVRQVLIGIQFFISACLIVASTIIWSQMDFIINSELGFQSDQQIVINLNSDESRKNRRVLTDYISQNLNITSFTGAASSLVAGDMNLIAENKTIDEVESTYLNFVDENYIKTLGIKLIAGENFRPFSFPNTEPSENIEDDFQKEILLNESAVKAFGYDVNNVIGRAVKRIRDGKTTLYRVVGVMENYHFYSKHAMISPFGLILSNPNRFNTIILNVKGKAIQSVRRTLEEKWRSINPSTPFSAQFLNDQFEYDYAQDKRFQKMIGSFTMLSIVISCLGLIGMISYTLSQRKKEIATRRVIGCSTRNLITLFSKNYLAIVLLANVICWPVAWYFMNNWLQGFAYRVNISWWIFLIALLLEGFIALLTMGIIIYRAARANPIKNLRIE